MTNIITKEQLLEIKEQIEEAKSDTKTLEGRMEYLMQQLGDKLKCKSIEEARKLLKKYELELEKIDTEITVKVKAVQEEYDLI